MLDVIMPVKNGELFVESALTSTLRALGRYGRLLVMDDGSNDSTPDILQTFAKRDNRLVLFRNETPKGVSGSLNALLEETSAEFVARMDADDICLPWRFKYQLRHMENVDFQFGGFIRFGTKKAVLRQSLLIPMSSQGVKESLKYGNTLCHPTSMFRREAIFEIGGYSTALAEDYATWIKAAAKNKRILRKALPVLLYRFSSGQTSKQLGWEEKALQQIKDSEDWNQLIQEAVDMDSLKWTERIIIDRAKSRKLSLAKG